MCTSPVRFDIQQGLETAIIIIITILGHMVQLEVTFRKELMSIQAHAKPLCHQHTA